jgi:hypothetical protein
MKKKGLRILGIIVLLLVLIGVVVALLMNVIVKTGIEKGGTYALQTNTTVASVDLKPLSGAFTMNGLSIANPEGFSSDHLLSTGKFDVQLQTKTLFSNTLVMDKFVLDGLDLNIEQHLGGSNIAKLMDNLKRFQTTQAQAKQPNKPGKQVRIDRVVINNVVAHFHLLSSAGSPAGEGVIVKVPEIVMTNVTSDNAQGAIVGQLMAKLLPAIIESVAANAKGLVPTDLTNELSSQASAVTGAVTGAVTAGAKGLTQQAEKTFESLIPKAKK